MSNIASRRLDAAFGQAGVFRVRKLQGRHEYRSFDPRPRNVSSDIKADFSLGYLSLHGSVIGYAGYRKYHQRQDVSFMKQYRSQHHALPLHRSRQ